MKRLFLIVSLILGSMTSANAGVDESDSSIVSSTEPQPKAIGVKIGWGAEFSYQQSMEHGFMEVNLGMDHFNSLDFATFYNFILAQPEWTDTGSWCIYAGPGASVGMKLLEDPHFFHISVAGMMGLEYSFDYPLQLSFDIKPQLGVGFGHGFYWRMTPSIGIRYRF